MKKNIFIFGLFLLILPMTVGAKTVCTWVKGSGIGDDCVKRGANISALDNCAKISPSPGLEYVCCCKDEPDAKSDPSGCCAVSTPTYNNGNITWTIKTYNVINEAKCTEVNLKTGNPVLFSPNAIANADGTACVARPNTNSGATGCCYTRETSTVNTVTLIEKAQIITKSECESLLLNNFNNSQGTRRVDVQFSPNLVVDADSKKCVTQSNKGSGTGAGTGAAGGASGAGAGAGQAFVNVQFDYTGMTNPLNTTDIPTVVGKVVKAILSILGSIFLIMIIYGGFTWMTAMGNDAKVKKGRNILVWAIVGITVIFLAWVLVALVFESINV